MANAFKPMTKDDVADLLGLSLRTIENWVNEGILPLPKKLGNRVYWHPDVFYSWLEGRLTASDATETPLGNGTHHPIRRDAPARPTTSGKLPKTELDKLRARDKAKLDGMVRSTTTAPT